MKKKRILFILSMLQVAFFSNGGVSSVKAYEIDQFTPYDALGCGINAKSTISTNLTNLSQTHTIFNDKIDELRTNDTSIDQFYGISSISTSLKDLTKNITTSLKLSDDFALRKTNPYTKSIFDEEFSSRLNDVHSSYYYYRANIKIVKTSYYSFENKSYDEYLNPTFKSYIEDIKNSSGQEQIESIHQLFDRYGTHIIVGGSFGGMQQYGIQYHSNKAIIPSIYHLKNTIDSCFTLRENDTFTNVSPNISTTLQEKYDKEYIDGSTLVDVKSLFIHPNAPITQNWYEGIDKEHNAFILPVENMDSYAPLWSYVNDDNLKEIFKSAFISYMSEEQEVMNTSNYNYAILNNEFRFGARKNNYRLNIQMPLLNNAVQRGYDYLNVTLQFDAWRRLFAPKDIYIQLRDNNEQLIDYYKLILVSRNAMFYTITFNLFLPTSLCIDDSYFDFSFVFDTRGYFFKTHSVSNVRCLLEYLK